MKIVQFIDFARGKHEGYLRFKTPENADEVYKEFTENKPVVGGNEIEIKKVEGDEEKEYWDKISELRNQKKGRPSKRGRRGGNSSNKRQKKE